MTEPPLGDELALRRFRAAIAAAEAAPSEASIDALRQAAIPLINQLCAAYAAAGRPYGEGRPAMYRWLEDVIARRDGGVAEDKIDSEGGAS